MLVFPLASPSIGSSFASINQGIIVQVSLMGFYKNVSENPFSPFIKNIQNC